MLGREISVNQVLKDISAGIGDRAMSEKYKLSPKGLEDLYRQLADLGFIELGRNGPAICRKRKIPTRSLVHDIRSGLNRRQLMAKYVVSSRHLNRLIEKLLATGVVPQEVFLGLSEPHAALDKHEFTPRLPRNYLAYPFPIYVVGDPDAAGFILDITEEGMKVEGIGVQQGEVKTFSIIASDVSEARPFVLEATCRWITQDSEQGFQAGFQITKCSDHGLRELRKFILASAPAAW
jgi:hypothetical protein